MNPHFAQIALGLAAALMFRGRFLKSLAAGFTHYRVQTLLVALAGGGPAALQLPLVVQLIFFPITMLPERFGISIPFGALLNSGPVTLAVLVALRALDHKGETPRDPAPPSTTSFQDALNTFLPVAIGRVAKRVETAGEVQTSGHSPADNVGSRSAAVGDVTKAAVDWLHSLRASTVEIQSIQDGTRYWVSIGKIPWGLWMITVAARGFLGTKRTIYSLCVAPPDPSGTFTGRLLQSEGDGGRIKWVSVSSFTEEDGHSLQRFISNVVQVAPREQWDFLITRELHAHYKALPAAQAQLPS